jgi:hypothetical protein
LVITSFGHSSLFEIWSLIIGHYDASMRWIIGDVHGMLRSLESLLELVLRDDPDAQLLFVGDYVNRGPDSRGVIDKLLTLNNARFVRGNHDDVFDLILHGKCYAEHGSVTSPLVAFQWFMEHGVKQTLMSYGVDEEELDEAHQRPSHARLRNILDRVPEPHRAFIRNLPAVIEYSDLFILHAWWNVKEETENPSIAQRLVKKPAVRQSIVWGRYSEAEIYGYKPWNRTGYFGHTAVTNYGEVMLSGHNIPVMGPNIVLLDTGCALGSYGRLTAFCAETQTFLQVDPNGVAVEEI